MLNEKKIAENGRKGEKKRAFQNGRVGGKGEVI